MRSKKGLLGYYNYTVILTYIGMLVAFFGIALVLEGEYCKAVLCLMVAGACDMIDGAVASTRPRMPKERRFGVQIDSLCDLICFGVLPALMVYILNGRSGIALVVCSLYVLCALIRLAYFNVLEEERQDKTRERRSCYLGLPVTTIALLLPALFGLDRIRFIPVQVSSLVLLCVAGAVYLLPVRIKKPHWIGRVIMLVVGAFEVCFLMIGAT